MPLEKPAPGSPGIPARWTSSAKSGVGTALTARSRVWFTLSHGILNEIYYPRIDQACTRDFGLIVTDGALVGTMADYRLYALIAPHLVNRGAGNTAWIDDYKGVPMLFAEGAGRALAVGCSAPFLARSAGFVGASDGWQDLSEHFELRWRYDCARDGNVALTGEIDLAACGGSFVLALGFGQHAEEAALRVRLSLADGADAALAEYTASWRAWQETLVPLDRALLPGRSNTYRISTSVLRTHAAASFPGGYIASLSIPWGTTKGDEDLGGYHLVWPRDLVEIAGGLLAAGAKSEAREVIRYLQAIQEPDGHWPQNCWLDGTPYWNGVQMDECAFPILLVDLAGREAALPDAELEGLWPMVERAAGFVVRNGPVTGQDRWEEDGGYSPFTLAVEIAALLAAADLAEQIAAPGQASYLRETADIWNGLIEHWIYATDTSLAKELGVDGYYVRIAPPETADAASPLDGFVPIKNRPPQASGQPASLMVSPDALALVRFGLRAPGDPRIRNTVRVIDALLKVDLPAGPCWRRYNGDGYGEHEDGRAFDGTGVGRPWPLLTGERAHYELAAAPGRMPSMSSCCARSRTGASSTCRRSRASATRSKACARATASGASITSAAACRRAASCASRSSPQRSSIGAATAGARSTTRRPGTAVSASTLPTSIPPAYRLAVPWSLRSTGRATTAGKVRTIRWRSTRNCRTLPRSRARARRPP